MLQGRRYAEGWKVKAVTSSQMREIDRRAREEFGIPELILMEHAGLEVARKVRQLLASSRRGKGRVLVLAWDS